MSALLRDTQASPELGVWPELGHNSASSLTCNTCNKLLMTPITVTTGKEARDEVYAKQYVFWVPRSGADECFIGDAAGDSTSGITAMGTVSKVPAITGQNYLRGSWLTTQVNCPNGAVLKISGTLKAQRLALPRTGNLLVRVREDGPMHRVKFPTLQQPANQQDGTGGSSLQWAEVVGRFDILDIAQAEALGVTIKTMFRPSYSEHAVSIFTIDVLEPARRAPAAQRLVTAPQVAAVIASATSQSVRPAAQFFRKTRVRNFGAAPGGN